MSTVSELLAGSRAAHNRRRQQAGHMTKDGAAVAVQPDIPAAESSAAEALRLRLEAEEQDPTFSDPAWKQDLAINRFVPHQTLVNFLRGYPEIP